MDSRERLPAGGGKPTGYPRLARDWLSTRLVRLASGMLVSAALAVTTLLAALFAPGRATPEAAGAGTPTVAVHDRIDIVHEVVRIDVTRPAVRTPEVPGRRNRAVGTLKALRADSGAASPASSRRSASALSRAARALAGDGRYRPEPFPTLRH